MMRKKVVSFDRFYEQKNHDYLKLLTENPILRSKTAKRRRIFTHQSRCSTETPYETIPSKRTEGHFLVSGLESRAQSPERINKTSLLKKNDKIPESHFRKAVDFENEEELFSNEYLKERLKLSKLNQCKKKEIVFASKFEQIQGLNSGKSFKIRSNKFSFLSNTINSKNNFSDHSNIKSENTNPVRYYIFNE